MKFCILFICCLLLVQNAIGQRAEMPNKTAKQANSNSNPRAVDNPNVTTIQAFSTKLYEEVKKSQPQNFVLSPFSLRNVLAMLSLGASRGTAKVIRESLQFPNSTIDLVKGQSSLISSLKGISSGNSSVKFVTADKIYAKSGLELRHPYKTDVKALGGEVENVDFGNSRAAARNINTWVYNKTEGKIEKLVEASTLTGQTSLLVLNTIYFKGFWKNPFANSSTKKRQFFLNGSCNVNVDMMYQKNQFQLADLEEAKAQVLVLPYKGGRLSMMIYLPNGKDESSLDSLENWLADKSPFDIQRERLNNSFIGEVSVSLPKFKIRSSLQLNEPLKKLGLGKMFDPATADFTGIFYSFGKLFVSKVSQETFMEVNEEGTEAAAATGIKIEATSFSPTPQFTADRPFLFQIVDSRTKTVLFTGRVKNPLDSGSGESTASAGQKEEPTCVKSQQVETTSKNIARAQNETNVPCKGGQKSDVEKMLMGFCNFTSSTKLNSTEDLKNNGTVTTGNPAARFEQCLKDRASKNEEVIQLNQNLTQTVKSLESKIQELERQQLKKNEGKTPASINTSKVTGKTTTTGTTSEVTPGKMSLEPQPAGAWGYYSRKSTGNSQSLWSYNETRHGLCLKFKEQIKSVEGLSGPSCVILYQDENCSKEKPRLQLDATHFPLELNMKIQYGANQAPAKSIGVCS